MIERKGARKERRYEEKRRQEKKRGMLPFLPEPVLFGCFSGKAAFYLKRFTGFDSMPLLIFISLIFG